MSVELGLAVVATADLCLRWGEKLIDLYRTVKGAHHEVEDILLRLESIWKKTSVQLRFMRGLSAKLEVDHARIQQQLLDKLAGTLTAATVKLESVIKTGPGGHGTGVKAVKYAFLKDSIRRTVDELRDWQSEYDPTWFLVVLIHDKLTLDAVPEQPQTSQEAGSNPVRVMSRLHGIVHGTTDNSIHINLDSKDFDISNAAALNYSTIKLLSRGSGSSTKTFLIDTLSCSNYVDASKAKRDAEDLARRLKVIDPETFGLLRCQGLVKSRVPGTRELSAIHFVFRMPSPSPTTLREELLRPAPPPSLSRILHLAQCLAKSVSFIHVCDFVHKNIRPETIITFPPDDTSPSSSSSHSSSSSSSSYGPAYLLGFDGFRDVNYQTLKAGDAAPERNLYRHPSRQGVSVQAAHAMPHDIYALGVCLLEIGLWTSFAAGPALGRWVSESWGQKVKEYLVALARERLPGRMGDRYTTVVLHCLTCLDADNTIFDGETMRDEDGVVVGVRFIEKVQLALGEISL
ncbi:hypothetical protein C8A01DRAFT_46812 [Parachaetomium inaequale]|uniref:Protein kinase domain-containing protein n=1 Tax=Parachaetomium inaequale TaxID=2588326 RepID=A0AAN6SRE1_9PEZI|nr:hypothetical protein C8A01DRAFT_46812 [Parachaetomium inaequale]